MPPSFAIVFSALLIFGPHVAMFVAAIAALTPSFDSSPRNYPLGTTLAELVVALTAIEAAGMTNTALGGTTGSFAWPWQALPITAAVIGYHVTQGTLAEVVVPWIARRPLNPSWRKHAFRGFALYMIGASIAAALAEAIGHRLWQVLPVAAASLYFVYRTYADYVIRLEHEHRRLEVIDSLEEGMCVIDRHSRITLWNDALERILGCPREHALGRSLAGALPMLADTGLPRVTQGGTGQSNAPNPAPPPAAFSHGRACSSGEGPARSRWCFAAVARHHPPGAGGAGAQANHRAARAGGGRSQRRPVAVGSARPRVLGVDTVVGHAGRGPGRGHGHESRGVVRESASGGHRRSQADTRGAPLRPVRGVPASASNSA